MHKAGSTLDSGKYKEDWGGEQHTEDFIEYIECIKVQNLLALEQEIRCKLIELIALTIEIYREG